MITAVLLYYNDLRFVRDALNSIFHQTTRPTQIILIDNGSTDNGLDFLDLSEDVIIVRSETNLTLGAARNLIIPIITQPYVAFIDSDDVWLNQKLETFMNSYINYPVYLFHSSFYKVDEELSIIEVSNDGLEGYCADLHFSLNGRSIGPPSTVIVRTDIFIEIGGFNPNLSISADWELNQRIARRYPVTYSSKPLVKYRVHNQNMSKNYSKFYGEMFYAICFTANNFNIPSKITKLALSNLEIIMTAEVLSDKNFRSLIHLARSLKYDYRNSISKIIEGLSRRMH